MESSSKMLSHIYPDSQNMLLGIFGSLGIGSYIIIAWLSSSRKYFAFSGAREAGHIHCDLVGDTILCWTTFSDIGPLEV